MNLEDDLGELSSPELPIQAIFCNFLDEPNNDQSLLFNEPSQPHKEEVIQSPQVPEIEEKYSFNLRSIEVTHSNIQKEDEIRLFPEEIQREAAEEDPLDFGLFPKKLPFDS